MNAPTLRPELEALGFTFEKIRPYKNFERWHGRPTDRLATVEVIGPAESYVQVAMMGMLSAESIPTERNAMLMHLVLSLLFPTWQGRGEWLVKSIANLPKSDATTQVGEVKVGLLWQKEAGYILLSATEPALQESTGKVERGKVR